MTAEQIYNKYVVNFQDPPPWTIPYTVTENSTLVDKAYTFSVKDSTVLIPVLQSIMDLPNFYCWPFSDLSLTSKI
jgi:hypothetical protein